MATKTKKAPTKMIGTTGIKVQSGKVETEWLRALQGDRGFEIMREMVDNDAAIGAVFYQTEVLIKQNDYYSKPAEQPKEATDANHEEAERIAEFVEECMNDMEHSWGTFIGEAFEAFPYGFQAHEVVYKDRLGRQQSDKSKFSRYNDGKTGWRGFYVRPPETLKAWDLDEKTCELKGMLQKDVTEEIPRERFLLTNIRQQRGNPSGKPGVRPCYLDWRYKKTFQEIEGTVYERGPGLPVLRLPPAWFMANASADDKASLQSFKLQAVSIRVGERMGICYPSSTNPDGSSTGFGLDFMGAQAGAYGPIRQAILDYRNSILTALGMQFLMLGQDQHGSFSLAEIHDSVAERIITNLMWCILEEVNQYEIPRLMTYNGIDEKYWPTIVPGDIAKAPLAQYAQSLVPLVQSGILTRDPGLEKHVREKTGLPELEERLASAYAPQQPKPAPKPEEEPEPETPPEFEEEEEETAEEIG